MLYSVSKHTQKFKTFACFTAVVQVVFSVLHFSKMADTLAHALLKLGIYLDRVVTAPNLAGVDWARNLIPVQTVSRPSAHSLCSYQTIYPGFLFSYFLNVLFLPVKYLLLSSSCFWQTITALCFFFFFLIYHLIKMTAER